MGSVVVGPAAVEAIRRLGADERKIVAANISRIRLRPRDAGLPLGKNDLRPPNTWRHVCPDTSFAVDYRWGSSREEQQAIDQLVLSLPDGEPMSGGDAPAGIEIVDVRFFYAL